MVGSKEGKGERSMWELKMEIWLVFGVVLEAMSSGIFLDSFWPLMVRIVVCWMLIRESLISPIRLFEFNRII